MNDQDILNIIRCPALSELNVACGGILQKKPNHLLCTLCGIQFSLHNRYGFPIFSPRSNEQKSADKYEIPDNRLAEQYIGLWCFGYRCIGRGEAEGFYRTLNELAFTTGLSPYGNHHILEIGCGVGRTLTDYAQFFINSTVIGFDLVERMLEFASILTEHPSMRQSEYLSLEPEGFGQVEIPYYNIQNTFLMQADALKMPIASNQIDLIVCSNIIDRLTNPQVLLSEISRVLRVGGYCILVDPLNWVYSPNLWSSYQSAKALTGLLSDYNFIVDISFDGLVYREILDIRGAHIDWNVAVTRFMKNA